MNGLWLADSGELAGILLLIAAIGFGAVGWFAFTRKRTNSKLQDVARRLKLRFRAPSNLFFGFGSVAGTVSGLYTEIAIVARGFGKRREYLFSVVINLPEPLGLDFAIESKGLFSKLGSALGLSKTFSVGDKRFDKAFGVSGRKRKAIKDLFVPPVKKAFLACDAGKIQVKCDDEGFAYESTTFDSAANLAKMIDLNARALAALWLEHSGEDLAAAEAAERAKRKGKKGGKKTGRRRRTEAEEDEPGDEPEAPPPLPKKKASGRKKISGKKKISARKKATAREEPPRKKASGKREVKPKKASGRKKISGKRKISGRKKASAREEPPAEEKVEVPCVCGATLRVRPAKLGKKARCPKCQEVVRLEV